MRDKFIGCMIGSALGDAVGELAFSHPEEKRLRSGCEKAERLTYTDDTAMAIGLAESLSERGGIDQEHLGRTFHRHYDREPWRGYASGPPAVFSLVRSSGMTYAEASGRLFGGEGSFGNGAAMRVAPVGLFYHDSSDLYTMASASAEVTHSHPLGRDGAAVQAFAVAQSVRLNPRDSFRRGLFVERLLSFAETSQMREKLQCVQSLIEKDAPCNEASEVLGKTVAVHESVPFALYAFLKHLRSYEACLFCAVLNGGDRDTLGAMAGALSGAYLGIEGVPQAWRSKLENRERIEQLALALLERKRLSSRV